MVQREDEVKELMDEERKTLWFCIMLFTITCILILNVLIKPVEHEESKWLCTTDDTRRFFTENSESLFMCNRNVSLSETM